MRRFDSVQRGAARRKAPSLLKLPGRRAPRPSDAFAKANAALVASYLTHKANPHGA